MTLPHPRLVSKFWSQVDVRGKDDCWPWLSGKSKGYGICRHNGQVKGAHVVAYETVYGPVPPGLEVDHVAKRGCKRKDCCNPRHLEAVTSNENVRRAREARRKARNQAV